VHGQDKDLGAIAIRDLLGRFDAVLPLAAAGLSGWRKLRAPASRRGAHRPRRSGSTSNPSEAADRADGRGLPRFIELEFREILTRRVLSRGFARVRCTDCAP